MSRKQKKAERTVAEGERRFPSPVAYQVPSIPERSSLPEKDMITTTIRYPRYVARMMDEWLLDHPGHGAADPGRRLAAPATQRTTVDFRCRAEVWASGRA